MSKKPTQSDPQRAEPVPTVSPVSLPKPQRLRDPEFLKWIRTQPCAASRCLIHGCYIHICYGGIEAHHIRKGSGIGTKPSDRQAIPLCGVAHGYYHSHGQAEFKSAYGIDVAREVKFLNLQYSRLHPEPKLKKTRKLTPTVKRIVVSCECGREHKVSGNQIIRSPEGFDFWCSILKGYRTAQMRAAR